MLRAMNTSDVGRLVWYELLTTDPKAAIEFYRDVIGWRTEAWGDGGYTMFVTDQGPVGGVTTIPEAAKQMGASPWWQANFLVADVDATAEQAKQLGGKIYHAETVPTIGRLAVIGDPQGAVITAFTPERDMPAHDVTKWGEFSWHELYTSDSEAGFAFYSKLAGWQRLGEFDMGPMGKYLLWGREGKQLGGMMTMPKDMKTPDGRDVPVSWMYYVTTPDLDGALDKAKALGARVLNGPMVVPGGQRIVQIMDPQGAAIAFATPPPSA
jgi:predicted enzyme related to lactoylglutathione lyase